MQVAVAFAYEPFFEPAREGGAPRGVLACGPGRERLDFPALHRIVEERQESAAVVLRPLQDSVGRAEPGIRRGDLDRAVKRRHLRREHVDVGGAELAAREEPTRQCLLRELAHFDCVLDRGPIAADDRSLDAAGDRYHVEVERGREAPIEPQLFLAEVTSRGKRREIEKAEIDGLLELVCEASGEKHIRDVRLEDGHTFAIGVETRRLCQRGDEPRLVLPACIRVGCHPLSYRRRGVF